MFPSGGARQQAAIPADADHVIGKKIMSQQGKEIGEIKDVLVEALIIERGGALGMGGKRLALPWDSVKAAVFSCFV